MLAKKLLAIISLFAAAKASSQIESSLNLLPVPKNIQVQQGSFTLTDDFSVAIHEPGADTIVVKAVNRMYQALNRRSGLYFKRRYISSKDNSATSALQIHVTKIAAPFIGVDESYSLTVTSDKIILNAPTSIGALHGLGTILQLLAKNDTGEFYFPGVIIQDAPRFPWRGLMIDVSRHFMPLDVLRRNIDAMATVKMNVLHLHLTDNEGFRIESKVFPQLQNKGSNGDYYTQAQIKDLIEFAEDRGIIIVPEFDMPGHTKSWFAGHPELASAPGPYEPGPPVDFHNVQQMNMSTIMQLVTTAPFPAFDPSKESTYQFIDKFIAEMSGLFPSPFIHIGADENNGVVWKNNPDIVAFMQAHHIENTHALQAYFVSRVREIVKKNHKQMIGWEEMFSKDIAPDATVQVWQNSAYTKKALEHGNPVLISKGFYLDQFMPAYIEYKNPELPDSNSSQVRGGEAAEWTEIADKTNIETRIWPRAAAVAERLWSPASVTDTDDMYRRLFAVSEQLDEQGLQHIADYERGLRRISNEHFDAVKTLADVLAPIRGYKKLFAQLGKPESVSYQTAPLVQVSDIVFVDSRVKWQFRNAVRSYLVNKDAASEAIIMAFLMRWQNNHEQLKNLFAYSSQLKAVEEHSKNLAAVSAIGIDALRKIKAGGSPDANWTNEKLAILKSANKSYGETELCIIPEIEALVSQRLAPLPASYPIL